MARDITPLKGQGRLALGPVARLGERPVGFGGSCGGAVSEGCHGRVGALKFLSYLRTRDPERILPYVDRGTFVF